MATSVIPYVSNHSILYHNPSTRSDQDWIAIQRRMDCHEVSLGSSCCSLDSCLLIRMPAVPNPCGPWTGGRVREGANVPDLLSEDVDERVERFMDLYPTHDDRKPSASPATPTPRGQNAQVHQQARGAYSIPAILSAASPSKATTLEDRPSKRM